MSEERKITATLKNARAFDSGSSVRYQGFIYGDVNGRFNDGELVITSAVVDQDNDIIVTQNSVYKIEKAA